MHTRSLRPPDHGRRCPACTTRHACTSTIAIAQPRSMRGLDTYATYMPACRHTVPTPGLSAHALPRSDLSSSAKGDLRTYNNPRNATQQPADTYSAQQPGAIRCAIVRRSGVDVDAASRGQPANGGIGAHPPCMATRTLPSVWPSKPVSGTAIGARIHAASTIFNLPPESDLTLAPAPLGLHRRLRRIRIGRIVA